MPPMICRLLIYLLITASALADESKLEPMLKICGGVAQELRAGKGISNLHLEKIRQIKDAPARLAEIAVNRGIDGELRAVSVRLLEDLKSVAEVNSLLPIALDVKETFRLRKQVLDTAAALQDPTLPEVLVTMVETKADEGLLVWGRFASLHVDPKSKAFERLLELLKDKDPEIRLHAIQFLVSVRHPEAASHLELVIADNFPEVRAWAILAMAFQGRREDIRHLKRALQDPSPLVKSKAVVGLSYPPYGKETGAKKIILLFDDELHKLSQWSEEASKARQAWEDLDGRGKKLRQRLSGAEKEERVRIEEDLRKIQLELTRTQMDHVALYQKILEEERLLVSIILALPHFDPEKNPDRVLQFLLSLLGHELPVISEAALIALGGIDAKGVRSSPLMPTVLSTLIAHWQRVKGNPALERRLHQLLLDLTEASDVSPSGKAWKKWWEQTGKRQFPK